MEGSIATRKRSEVNHLVAYVQLDNCPTNTRRPFCVLYSHSTDSADVKLEYTVFDVGNKQIVKWKEHGFCS